MRKFLIPTKDTTIYQAFPTNNAGLDEILEIGKVIDETKNITPYDSASARALLYFDTASVGTIPSGAAYFLNLRLANANDVIRGQELQIFPITTDWVEGSGYFYQDIKNVSDGASWTAAKKNVSWSNAGGDTAAINTQSVYLTEYPLTDMRINVSNVVAYAGPSYGMMIKFPATDETDAENIGNIKVFSSQTHTIHQPILEVAWDDQVFVTGSLRPLPSTLDIKIASQNIKETYVRGEVSRIDFTVRDEYPVRTFDATLRYKAKYYLPQTTYYSITDVQANTVVVPFDEYSKVHCDTTGVYINLDTSGLYRGRFYSIQFKIVLGAYTKFVNNDWTFRIL
jgi:hypothetical protein